MLFEKCESATRNIEKVTTTDQFNTDIDDFASAMQNNRLSTPTTPPLMSGDEELDTLVYFWYTFITCAHFFYLSVILLLYIDIDILSCLNQMNLFLISSQMCFCKLGRV